jgi:hypothetical protein
MQDQLIKRTIAKAHGSTRNAIGMLKRATSDTRNLVWDIANMEDMIRYEAMHPKDMAEEEIYPFMEAGDTSNGTIDKEGATGDNEYWIDRNIGMVKEKKSGVR